MNARRYRTSVSPTRELPVEEVPTTGEVPQDISLKRPVREHSLDPLPVDLAIKSELDDVLDVTPSVGTVLPAGVAVKLELDLGEVVLDEASVANSPMLPYVRTLIWLIDGIALNQVEVIELLQQALRQHSMAWSGKVDYALRFLHLHPS